MRTKVLLLFLFQAYLLSAQVDNYALHLTATDYVNAGHISSIDEADKYTIQCWFNPSSWSPGAALFTRGTADNEISLRLGAASGQLIFQSGSHSATITAAAISANKWSHITVQYTGGTLTVRVNNTIVYTGTADYTIPTSSHPFIIGEHYNGRIDELRIWTIAVPTQFLLWRNTLNRYHPQWDQLVLYYKFDQNLCDNVVDYTFRHHGVFGEGARRDLVTDNNAFKYRKQMAYTDFSRFADRGVDREKYLLANDIIMLGVESYPDGSIVMPFPNNQGNLINANHLQEFEGRTGVISFNGEGAGMEVGKGALEPDNRYSFHTWIYLEEWTEGAYIFQKEAADTQGFSIRLGSAESKEIIVRLNGQEFKRPITPTMLANPTGNWWHLGIVAFSLELGATRTFLFTVNGKGYFPNTAGSPTSTPSTHVPIGWATTDAVVGKNLNAKLDETAIWNIDLSEGQVQSYMQELPMPGFGKIITAATVFYKMNSFWNYDNSENPGYDSYSYLHFMDIVRSAFDGYRGYTLRMSVKGHNNWQSTIADAGRRKKMAEGIVAAAADFDGIDLDFEWCYDGTCFNNYGLLIEEVGKLLPPEKIYSVSPHYVSYAIPTRFFEHVDYFNFQIYGPQPYIFRWNTFTTGYGMFINHGYPKDKILMSYATTTSRASTDINGNNVLASSNPIGVRNGLLEAPYTPDQDVVMDANGYYRHITGVNQTYNRSEFVQTNDLAGIFYWDMGNDVPTAHQYSLPKWSNFAIASNVDTIITQVNVHPTSLQRPQHSRAVVSVYPNPATDYVVCSLPTGETPIRIVLYNAAGQAIDSISGANLQPKISVKQQPGGIYTLRIHALGGTIYTGKFIKN
jgi:hypothetical protein